MTNVFIGKARGEEVAALAKREEADGHISKKEKREVLDAYHEFKNSMNGEQQELLNDYLLNNLGAEFRETMSAELHTVDNSIADGRVSENLGEAYANALVAMAERTYKKHLSEEEIASIQQTYEQYRGMLNGDDLKMFDALVEKNLASDSHIALANGKSK